MSTLYIVSTPIGNLKDITIRAVDILKSVGVVVCEDTRHTGKLLEFIRKDDPGHKRPDLISLTDFNEVKRIPQVLTKLQQGFDVALVTDAGSPLISDPGFALVTQVINQGLRVEAIPGATSIIPAVQLSGLPADRILFWGFLPKRYSHKKEVFEKLFELSNIEPQTVVLFESPFRLAETIELLKEFYPNSLVSVVRELTKLHEEILRGSPVDVSAKLPDKILGEVTLVVRMN